MPKLYGPLLNVGLYWYSYYRNMHKKERKIFSEFTVLGMFTAVVMLGFLYGGIVLIFPAASPSTIPMQQNLVLAPTVEEYQHEVRGILAPFIGQVRNMNSVDIADAGNEFSDLLLQTQDRLLGVRVPASMRDAHLAFVLLLEQWRRASDGSNADQAEVLAQG